MLMPFDGASMLQPSNAAAGRHQPSERDKHKKHGVEWIDNANRNKSADQNAQ
jgi:hypothetical protein